jgi:hypothetical protein
MTQERAEALVHFLWYVINDGQNLANSSNYASLPDNIVDINTETINLLTFNGQTITTIM